MAISLQVICIGEEQQQFPLDRAGEDAVRQNYAGHTMQLDDIVP
jgi:hypothetical protein